MKGDAGCLRDGGHQERQQTPEGDGGHQERWQTPEGDGGHQERLLKGLVDTA